MSLTTLSKFYFGHTVTSENNLIDFKEGAGPELTATLTVGDYSLTEYAAEIKRVLDAAGALTYTVTFSRSTRVITITTTSTFSLLVSSGTHIGTGAFSMMGFTGADRTGASTYAGNTGSGSSFQPQFVLQDHVSSDDEQRSVEATVIRSASGRVEVVTFGTERFVTGRMRWNTNLLQPSNGPITSSVTGLSDLRTFMQYITTKAKVEYMPDKDTPSTYETVILESNEENPNGSGYKLRERYDIGLPGYFDTSILKFRVIE